MGRARNGLGCASARHSLPVISRCSVVQNGASSASLNRLSVVARGQFSSRSLLAILPHVNVQCAPADCPQRKGLCPAPVPVCSLPDELERARLQDLHILASVYTLLPLQCGAQRGPTQVLGRYLCRELVQAHSPWPSGHTSTGHVCVQLLRCGVCCSRGYRRRLASQVVRRIKTGSPVVELSWTNLSCFEMCTGGTTFLGCVQVHICNEC